MSSSIESQDYLNSINFATLNRLLATGQWEAADLETRRIMLQVTGADSQASPLMSKQQLMQFPCKDLMVLDQLWVKHSQGRFGFSVVQQIYQTVGEDYTRLAEQVGWYDGETWIQPSQINFSSDAPRGHLPLTWLVPTTFGVYWLARFASPSWRLILARLRECAE